MDKLPIEILHCIFIEPHMRQRLECTLVCRQWADLLRSRSLFHSVTMAFGDLYDRFVDMMERFPARTKQVEILKLYECCSYDYDKRKLFSLFPNLRIIKLFENNGSSDTYNFRSQLYEFTQSKHQVTHVTDRDECELTFDLMASNLCASLVDLKLFTWFSKDPMIHFFSLLKNAPVLKNLSLKNVTTSLDDMETIHGNLPSLDYFDISRCELADSIMPIGIQPALVTKLRIRTKDYEPSMEKVMMFLKYIEKKYTSLTDLNFLHGNIMENDFQFMSRFYEDGILPIAKARGSQLKTLPWLRVTSDIDFFKDLHAIGCRLVACKMVSEAICVRPRELAESKQAKHIQELSFMRIHFSSYKWLKQISSLKKLSLDYFDRSDENPDEMDASKKVDLNELLGHSPDTLETLSMDCPIFTFATPTVSSTFIHHLSISHVALPKGVDKYIAAHFPNLKTLQLHHCLPDNATLSLPKHNLLELNISAMGDKSYYYDFSLGVMVKTSKDKYPRYYIGHQTRMYYQDRFFTRMNNKDFDVLEFRTPIAKVENEDRDCFRIACDSLKKLIVDGYALY